jgi:putative oxidoreductase
MLVLMSNSNSCCAKWSPRLLSVMRIVVALLFMEHGSQKLFGIPENPMMKGGSLTPLMEVAAILEFGGGLFLLVGFLTRPAAFILSGEMAVAYFMVHAKMGPWPVTNHGELAVLYCFVFLYLSVAGGGAWGLDCICRCKTADQPSPSTKS